MTFFSTLMEDPKFFVALATVIFFVATFKPMKKGLMGMLDSRIEKIKKDLSEAQRLRDEAEALFRQAESKLAKSAKESEEIVAHAKKEAELIVSNTKQKLEKDIETRKKLALQKIQSFEENAISELKKNVSNITVIAAGQAIEESADDESFKKLINSSLDKLSKTVH